MKWSCLLAFSAALAVCLQAEEGARVLIQEALLRPPGPRASSAEHRPPARYRSVAAATEIRPAKDDAVVGITFWRLRVARPNDDPGSRLLLLDDAGMEVEQVPERIEAGSAIRPGERIRLSIEVPRKGFLYVFDREQFRDGKTGPAHLIYPNFQTPRGDNAVAAGRLIEVPDRRDRIQSFKLVKSRPDHAGELLMVLVSPTPLDLRTDSRTPAVIEESLMSSWEREFGLQVQQVELDGTQGQPLTASEKKSGGDKTQLLTQEDPYPQTMYLVKKAKPGNPILIKVPIRIGAS